MVRITHIDQFILEIEQLFDKIAGPWSALLFREKYRQSINRAWSAIKRTVVAIRNSVSELVINAVRELEEAGLAGAQLHLKLECLNEAWEQFYQNGSTCEKDDTLTYVPFFLQPSCYVRDRSG
jgi:hypothetical protein